MANGIESGVGQYFAQNPVYSSAVSPYAGGVSAPGASAGSGFGTKLGEGVGIGSALGGGLASLFGGSDVDMPGEISGAGQTYQKYLQEALGQLQGSESQGRGDISKYYGEASQFGAPYREAGQQGLESYLGTLGIGSPEQQQTAVSRFRSSPGYQFALQQGLQATRRADAARGLTGSGAEQRELQRVGQGLASQEFGKYQQRLSSLAGIGEQEAARGSQAALGTGRSLATLGAQYASPIAGLYGTMGQAEAESRMAAAKERQTEEAQQSSGLGSLIGGGLGALAMFI